jgi:phosphatidate phosphatase APP1
MSDWQEVLAPFVHNVEAYYDALKYKLAYALGGPGPIKVLPYRGHGTEDRLHVIGRVLKDRGIGPAMADDPLWKNMLNTYKRMASREIPYARLRLRFQDVEREVTADEEGMFEVWLHPDGELNRERLWHHVEATLLEPAPDPDADPVAAIAEILVPPKSARFGVISDIDDTVLQTDATNLLRMARTVFLGNAHTRLPFPGAAAFYRALHAGPGGTARNPLFYVSNSPWNLYDLLSQFFQLHEIPVGPVLFLRNWGVSRDELLPTNQVDYKLPRIRQVLDTHADLPFILIGDSGEEDPEIYHEIVRAYGDRILAVYIRNVSQEDPDRPRAIEALAGDVREAGSALVMADDSLALARHAANHGWIMPEALPRIKREKEKDEGPPTPVERLLTDQNGEAPTTVVEDERPSERETV